MIGRIRSLRDGRHQGQALVEFALVIPILMIVFMGVVETALALNAVVGVNRASQQAAHLASILGSANGADCLILQEIEGDMVVPNDRGKIREVRIQRTAMLGNTVFATTRYDRGGGNIQCYQPDGTPYTLPYVLVENGYPEAERCMALLGCPAVGSTPKRSTVDNVAVDIQYRHLWATPLNSILNVFGGGDVGWNISQRNIFRMEPTI